MSERFFVSVAPSMATFESGTAGVIGLFPILKLVLFDDDLENVGLHG